MRSFSLSPRGTSGERVGEGGGHSSSSQPSPPSFVGKRGSNDWTSSKLRDAKRAQSPANSLLRSERRRQCPNGRERTHYGSSSQRASKLWRFCFPMNCHSGGVRPTLQHAFGNAAFLAAESRDKSRSGS